MGLSRYIKIKDRLVVLMIVCIVSNIILAIFAIDYLRKMENNTQLMYEQRLLALLTLSDFELAVDEGEVERANEVFTKLVTFQFDSQMEYYFKEMKTNLKDGKIEKILSTTELTKQYIIDRAQKQIEAYKKDLQFGYILLCIISVIMITIVVYFSIVASRAVNKPTRELKKLLKLAGQGDFTQIATYDSKDELGEVMRSYNKMATEVKELLKVVQTSTKHVSESNNLLQQASEKTTEAAILISNDAKDLTRSTEKSSEQLLLNTAAIQEISTGIEYIVQKIQFIESRMNETKNEANDGVYYVADNKEKMKEIEIAVKQTNDKMQILAKHSNEISAVIQIINQIAEQTSLLALNAAIESARAGEYGKGFSVVAAEVRKLADQSVHSTKVIEHLVEQIQQDSKESILYMEHAISSVQKGIETTNQTAGKFEHIVSNVNDIGPHIEEVSSIITQIKENTKEVANHSTRLSETFELNTESIKHVSKSTVKQLDATREMHEEIQKITKNIRALLHSVRRFNV